MLARLARDLPPFLRSPLGAAQAAQIIRRRLETRSERFLHLAERAIYYGLEREGCQNSDSAPERGS